MTDAKTREEWLTAWRKEVNYLTRVYQCKADSQLYDQLKFSLDAVNTIVETIADRMESEGVWRKNSWLGIQRAYREWKNCGNTGSMMEYCKSVGVRVEDLE